MREKKTLFLNLLLVGLLVSLVLTSSPIIGTVAETTDEPKTLENVEIRESMKEKTSHQSMLSEKTRLKDHNTSMQKIIHSRSRVL